MTLSKNQKKYRKRKKEESKDFHKVKKEEGKVGHRVGTRRLTVRVNEESYEQLKSHSVFFKKTMSEMLSHIINVKTDQYAVSGSGDRKGSEDYWWKEELLETSRSNRRKGTTGTRMLSLSITSTSFKSLKSHSNDHNYSMARLVQTFILNYVPTTEKQKESKREYLRNCKEKYERFKEKGKTLLTEEEQQVILERYRGQLESLKERELERKGVIGTSILDDYLL